MQEEEVQEINESGEVVIVKKKVAVKKKPVKKGVRKVIVHEEDGSVEEQLNEDELNQYDELHKEEDDQGDNSLEQHTEEEIIE